jgi:hypothetical protein
MESADLDRRCIYTEFLFYDRRFAKDVRVNVLGGWLTKVMESFDAIFIRNAFYNPLLSIFPI